MDFRRIQIVFFAAALSAAASTAFAQAPQSQPAQKPAAAASADGPKFEIRKYIFEGATLISREDLEEATRPYTGPGRSFADVQRSLEAIEKLYGARGFSAVQVALPEQELDKGEIRFSLIEAKLGRLIVEGNKFFDEANIRASLPALVPGTAPNINEIARNLRIANENPAKQTQVLLRSGQEEATVDAVARVVDESPYRASMTVDATGTKSQGVFRTGFGFQHGNMLGRDHVLTLQYVTAPYDENNRADFDLFPSKNIFILGFGYRIPLYASGDTLDFTAGYSTVNSGTVAQLFTISGAGGIFGVRYTKNLDRIGDYEHKAILSWDFRGYHSKGIRPVGSTFQLIPDVTVHPISVSYNGLYRGQDHETGFSMGVSQNLPGGNDGTGTEICLSRSNGLGECANPNYLIGRWSVNHNRALANDFQMRVAMNGQVTRDMLISGEQFGAGGADSVRGFLEREVTNDTGYRGTVEFYSPDWGGKTGIAGARARAVYFFDWAAVKRNRPGPAEAHSTHIASQGFGLRFSRGTNVSLRLDFGVVQDPGGNQGKNDGRLHGSFSYIF